MLINDIGEEIARAVGVAWLPSDFKKRDGENRSIELCEQYHVYRQLYCGCEYSLHRREEGAESVQVAAESPSLACGQTAPFPEGPGASRRRRQGGLEGEEYPSVQLTPDSSP